MFKEAFVILLILTAYFLIMKVLLRFNDHMTRRFIFLQLLCFVIAGAVYNLIVMFPDFYLDTVGGSFRYGTFSGNLLAYNREFMFKDEMIIPLVSNRTVYLDDPSGVYLKYFSMYSGRLYLVSYDADEKTSLCNPNAYSFREPFETFGVMDYVKEDIPPELAADFEDEVYPYVCLNPEVLGDADTLTVISDSDYNLYIIPGHIR